MEESYTNLPSSQFLGSVPFLEEDYGGTGKQSGVNYLDPVKMEGPFESVWSSLVHLAVVSEDNKTTSQEAVVPGANLQIFPPNSQGYQTLGTPSDGGGQQPTNNWKGLFSISSYTQYFNVDTDIVLNRLISSLYPTTGDFVSKIDANPDLYGLVWISTTLVFVIASLGNCATYLMQRRSDSATSWAFDVNYVNVAAGSIYGYALIVPLGYYFCFSTWVQVSALYAFGACGDIPFHFYPDFCKYLSLLPPSIHQ
ncbi:hypothetical protein DH2020_022228 [Rehmannia glutinosa]|uniref:Protein YIP n=1 Tax=Rehmannia glutinosa TaxID=99300 RepID=A0ABR0WD35_REHGL